MGRFLAPDPLPSLFDHQDRVDPLIIFKSSSIFLFHAAASSTQRLALIAGKYVGKDDPVCIVRSQGQFPAVGEALEPFTRPHIVEGWMRGSHHGPLMPIPAALMGLRESSL